MTYDNPFRNRMDDDEDMPRGYKMTYSKTYSEHVEICLDEESDVNTIADLIDERVERDIRVTCDMYSPPDAVDGDGHFLWYVFEGTEEELAEMRKTIRRLSRGNPRFMFVFEGMS